MNEKQLHFNARVANYEQLNEQFMKVKINICHKGKNANRTEFTEEAMRDLERTVLGVPVVGEFDTDNREFKGHGGKLVAEDDRVEWIRTTQPYGFVPMDQVPFYETILEPDGLTKNDYLTVYAILWTEIYPELYEAFEKKVHQSMEIRVGASEWNESNGYCTINQASMSALCLLQSVKPCFKSSVATNQFSEDGFDQQYQRLVEQYRLYALGEGGDEMEEQKETINEETVSSEETHAPESNEETPASTEVPAENHSEVEGEDANEEEEKDEVDAPVDEELATDETSETEDIKEEDFEALYHALKETHDRMMSELEATQTAFDALKVENEALMAFKQDILAKEREASEKALFARFKELEGFEGYADLQAKASEYELADLEIQLFALVGRKLFNQSTEPVPQAPTIALETTLQKANIPTVFGLLDEFIQR